MWGSLFVVAAVGIGAGTSINNAELNKEMFKNN